MNHFSLRALGLAAFVALGGSVVAHDQLVSPGSTWRYLDDGSDQGSAWREPSFDDDGWLPGAAQLGYGENDEATQTSFGPDPDDKYPTTYFRHTFSVPDPSLYVSLRLEVLRDDGAAVYLNGTEVLRDKLSAAATFDTFANDTVSGSLEDQFFESTLDAALLVPGVNVLAVEVHQVNATSSDMSFDLELVGETGLVLRRGPYLQGSTTSSTVLRWRTNVPSDSRIELGAAAGVWDVTIDDPALVTDHEFVVPASTSKTFYAIGSTSQTLAGGGAQHFFRAALQDGSSSPFRIWAVGDSGTADSSALAVRDAFLGYQAGQDLDLMLMLGDNAYNDGTDPEYQNAVFETYADVLRQTVVWPTRGNHDRDNNVYTGVFSLPTGGEAGGLPSGTEAYYSFDWGNVHFVCIDSQGSAVNVGGPMWTWLNADLGATAQTWIIAFWHHPPYSKGSHDSDTETALSVMRENFVPLLESHGVDLVLCGHSHSYERSYLIDGHHGHSSSFDASMLVDGGDGSENGDGAYSVAAGPGGGAVYTVAGCSGKLSDGDLDHPVMAVNILDVLGSVVIDVDGERIDVVFLDSNGQIGDEYTLLTDPFEGTFCMAKPTAQFGCLPAIAGTGTPSATSPDPYTISATAVVEQKNGLLFYGFGGTSIPFQGGTLCAFPPLRRTALQNSGGLFFCDGSFAFDFNAEIQGGVLPQLVPGVLIAAQYWFRDPLDPFGIGLSNALQFVVQP